MIQKMLNGKELRKELCISRTLFYKMKQAGMPYHQFPASRAYYLLPEIKDWLRQAGYHQEKTWSK